MNRSQRRGKTKPRTPTIFEVRSAFVLIDQMFDDLKTGCLEFASIDGGAEFAVFTDIDGDRQPVVPSLDAWIKCWDSLSKEFGFDLYQKPLVDLMHALEGANPKITPEQVARASAVVHQQRQAYRKLDVYKVKDVSNTARIKIALEDRSSPHLAM